MTQPRTINISPEDMDALARIIHAEAGNQSDTGKAAVLFTILNRAAATSGGFPNTVRGVIEQQNQFEPLRGKKSVFDLPPAPDATRSLVASTLAGISHGSVTDPTRGATFFQNTKITNQRGTNFASAAPTSVIEDHSFYNRYKLNPVVEVAPYTLNVNGTSSDSVIAPGGAPSPVPPSGAGSSPASFGGYVLAQHKRSNPMTEAADALGSGGSSLADSFSSGLEAAKAELTQPAVVAVAQAAPASYTPPTQSGFSSVVTSPPSGSMPAGSGKFELKPSGDHVKLDGVDANVIASARMAAEVFGSDLTINSAYRDQGAQDRIRMKGDPNRPTVAKNSYHTGGTALDISIAGMSRADQARLLDALVGSGFTGIGYYDSHIHADQRGLVPGSFGTRANWAGWTNMPEELMAVLKARGFRPGAPASTIRRGFGGPTS